MSSLLHVILYEPEIAPNTGNIIRLCANTGAALHLVQPLGYQLDDARLRRAGLDYHEYASLTVHASLAAVLAALPDSRVLAYTTRARMPYTQYRHEAGDALLFGPESRGLPDAVLAAVPAAHRLRLPMRPGSRSLNLANAVAVAVYEAWRQLEFTGAAGPP